ncbi:MAG: tetratricopeptide (TPR) repeat protein [Myxococcota bacterium]|jgi:tetratricopeptide (TPR) repeat protein
MVCHHLLAAALLLAPGVAGAQGIDEAQMAADCAESDLTACRMLGGQMLMRGDARGAAQALERNLVLTREQSERPLDVATWTGNLASAYLMLLDYDRAAELSEESVAIRREAMGAEHSSTVGALERLADVHKRRGDLDTAIPLFAEALEGRRAAAGKDHPTIGRSAAFLARAYIDAGRFADAEPLLVEIQRINKALAEKQPAAAGRPLSDLGHMYADIGRPADAQALVDLVLPQLGDTPAAGRVLALQARLQEDAGDLAGARATLDRALVVLDHPRVRRVDRAPTLLQLAYVRWGLGERADVLPDLRTCAEADPDNPVRSSVDLVPARLALGWALLGTGSTEEAVEQFGWARTVHTDLHGPDRRELAPIWIALAHAQPDQALAHLTEAVRVEGDNTQWSTTEAVLGMHATQPDDAGWTALAVQAAQRHAVSPPAGTHLVEIASFRAPSTETLGRPGARAYAAIVGSGDGLEIVHLGPASEVDGEADRSAAVVHPIESAIGGASRVALQLPEGLATTDLAALTLSDGTPLAAAVELVGPDGAVVPPPPRPMWPWLLGALGVLGLGGAGVWASRRG